MTDVNENWDDLLGGRATPSCSFRGQPPIEWSGVALSAKKMPAYEYDPTKPGNRGKQKFWDDGNPVEYTWVTLQTEIRDPNIEDDDGQRVLVLDSKAKKDALSDAVKKSGGKFGKGSWVRMQYYATDPESKNPDNPRKLYRAEHRPAAPAADDPWASVGSAPQGGAPQGPPPPWAAPATPAAPSPATQTAPPPPPPPPAAPAVDPQLVAFLASKGVTVGPEMTEATARMIAATFQ